MKFQIVLLCLSLIVNVFLFGQSSTHPKIAEGYTHFQTTLKKDTIDFVVAETEFKMKKPVLLFCQGSQPVPLFFDFPDQGIIPVTLNNFDVKIMKKRLFTSARQFFRSISRIPAMHVPGSFLCKGNLLRFQLSVSRRGTG